MSKKNISVEINNKHLDALEDLLYIELTKKETEKSKEKVKQLWHTLLEAYDSKKKEK